MVLWAGVAADGSEVGVQAWGQFIKDGSQVGDLLGCQ